MRFSKRRIVALLAGLAALSGCMTTATLQVETSNVPIVQTVPISVAVIIPEQSRAIASAGVGQTGCWGTPPVPGAYGQVFADTVRDRFSRLFDNAQIITSPYEAGDVDAIFEARLDKVEWAGGCLASPDGFFAAEGQLRAVDANGRQIWTSNKRQDKQMVGMIAQFELGRNFGQRIAALVDSWAVELQQINVAQYALDETIEVATAPRYSRSQRSTAPRSAAPVRARPASPKFPQMPVDVKFEKGPVQPDDIAVIIGNANYAKLGKDIPDVSPAYADALSVKRYVTEALGVKPGNVIEFQDATGSQMIRVFGSTVNYKGQLFDWVKPNRSRIYVYYAGHGAPSARDGNTYLVPSDADATRIDLNGYPLETLYANLGKLKAKEVTVVIEACFSGTSQAGSLVSKASPVFIKPKQIDVPPGVTVISAGAPEQIASWEEDKSHGLFTKYYLKGMAGEADQKPFGNGNGDVSYAELNAYLQDTLTYYARRYYGRDQTAQIKTGN